MLMLDRYLVAGGRALDLATGNTIRWRARRATGSSPTLFTMCGRSWLIDLDRRGTARIEVWERTSAVATVDTDAAVVAAFRGLLIDARDGQPRAFDLADSSAPGLARANRVLAREARLAGFVPMAADALGAVLAQAHWRWPSWLKDRSLVVFATDTRLSGEASLALFRLASKDARPHVIVRSVTAAPSRPRMFASALHVHEGAPSEASTTERLLDRADRLLGEGKFADAEAAARWSLLLSGEDDAPARCALARALNSQGRPLEARAAVGGLTGVEPEAVRNAIAQTVSVPRAEPDMVNTFLDILRCCQDADDEASALVNVAERLRASVACSVVAFVLHDQRRPHVVAHAGACAPSASQLAAAMRVLDTGVAEPVADGGRLNQGCWPIRYGATVVGAIWCHWAGGVQLLPQDVDSLLGIAVTAAAPAVHQLREGLQGPQTTAALVPTLVGESGAMDAVRQAVVRAARSPFPVLIEGESGSGKELVARAVHVSSARRTRKFCPLNCAAIADELVEAELFGHTRGAFTGALAERVGLFEEAEGGTLFLDEVAELGSRVQAKLLRTLQEHEIRRLGESTTRRVDARIVAATNRPLAGEVAAGRFRGDLRYRLDVLRIAIPPLRERLEDLPALVRHAWGELAKRTGSRAVLSPSAMSLLGGYDWPGNVRELQNVLASVMVGGPPRGVIGPQSLPSHITRATAVTSHSTLAQARRDFEARFVRAALARAGGSVMLAARDIGVSRQGLTKLTARLGIAVNR